jgi:hypothetical protein
MAALSGNLASSSWLFANRPFSGGHQTQLTTKLIPISRRDRDKPRQGVVANTLNLFPKGAVGFIDLRARCRAGTRTRSRAGSRCRRSCRCRWWLQLKKESAVEVDRRAAVKAPAEIWIVLTVSAGERLNMKSIVLLPFVTTAESAGIPLTVRSLA